MAPCSSLSLTSLLTTMALDTSESWFTTPVPMDLSNVTSYDLGVNCQGMRRQHHKVARHRPSCIQADRVTICKSTGHTPFYVANGEPLTDDPNASAPKMRSRLSLHPLTHQRPPKLLQVCAVLPALAFVWNYFPRHVCLSVSLTQAHMHTHFLISPSFLDDTPISQLQS